MTKAADKPEKQSHLQVNFQYGDINSPDFIGFTDWTVSQGQFMSTPTMKVTLPANSGVLDDAPVQVEIPLEADAWLEAYTEDVAREFVFVEITEVTRPLEGGPQATTLILFRGLVTDSVRNWQGDRIAMFECRSYKQRLDFPIAVAATHQCTWRLFGRGCLLNQTTFQRTGQLATIDGKVVTITTPNAAITSPTSPGGNTDRYWERGFLEKDGLQIPVMKWVKAEDATRFILRDVPPADWLLAGATSIRFVPGCHKTIEDCRDVWDNEQGVSGSVGGGFNGIGYAMVPYNPLFEKG